MDFESLMRAKAELEPRVKQLYGHLDPDRKALELEQIEEKASAPGFWDDPDAARPVLMARGLLTEDISTAKKLHSLLEDLETGLELSRDDSEMLGEAEYDPALRFNGFMDSTLDLRDGLSVVEVFAPIAEPAALQEFALLRR